MLNRAYSLLEVKSIDESERTITGVATTPTTDRVGDVVEPLGVKFRNPLPLLLFHDHTRPVGTVKFDTPTKDGITFTAKLANPDDASSASLKERVAEAWDSIRAKLIRGVSIGFRAMSDGVEMIRDADGGFTGLRFTKTEVLELSLVTVPANADATIHAIKSIDAPHLAAFGTVERTPTTPGATGTLRAKTRTDTRTMTNADKILDFTAQKTAKAARMTELLGTEDGATLDETQQQEFDGLTGEVKAIDAHLSRLEQLEQVNKSLAKPVASATPAAAAAARDVSPVYRVERKLEPGIEFTRLVACKVASFLEMQKGNFISALDVAKSRYPDDHRIHAILKAAVPAGTTSDAVYAGPLVDAQNLASEFVEFLRPQTILGKFGMNGIPALRRVPFNIRYTGQTSDAEAWWVGQGKPKPVTSAAFEATTLTWAKIATIAVITEELARFSSPAAEGLMRDAISAAIIKRMDIDFIDPDKTASAGVSPASITNGVAPLSSAGTSADNVRTDLMSLLATYVEANNPVSSVVLIMPDSLALALSLMVNSLGQDEFPNMQIGGGRLRGLPVITSQYVSSFTGRGNMVIAVNASEVFLADDGQVNVDVSREASLEMSNAPSQNGAAGSGASLVSLWQNNMIGLRAERFVNWAKRRSEAVAFIDDVNWGAIGSPAL